MAAWEDYRSCCRVTAARDRAAGFCPECGHRLFRCPAPDCGSLLAPLGHCAACVDLSLSVEKGAMLSARLGECLSVPFVLRNDASTRPLSIKAILREMTGSPREPVALAWDQLEAGRTRNFSVTAGPFSTAGRNSLRLVVVVCAGFGEVEETYAFSGEVAVDVEGKDPTQVVQNFNLAGADFGTAGMVVANPHADTHRRQGDALDAREQLVLERVERFEMREGLRGYDKLNARVARDAEFRFAGFPQADAPPNGPLLAGPIIRCGRNSRARDGAATAQPSDLCLRVYEAGTGALDREASAAISRHVCDFVLQDDRVYVRSATPAGLAVNGQRLDAAERRVVDHGDSFTVAAGQGKSVTFTAALRAAGAVVSEIRFEKTS
jgi:hypothetical protein